MPKPPPFFSFIKNFKPMNNLEKIKRWTEKLDAHEAKFHQLFGGLDSLQLNWKANPEKWSIGQCIDHLIVINSLYFPVFEKLAAGEYQPTGWQKWSPFSGMLGRMLHNSVKPESKRANKTMPVFEPSQSNIPGDILQSFSKMQAELKNHLLKMQNLDFQKTIISSPANQYITYSLHDAVNMLVDHEERHLLQAAGVLEQMNKNGQG